MMARKHISSGLDFSVVLLLNKSLFAVDTTRFRVKRHLAEARSARLNISAFWSTRKFWESGSTVPCGPCMEIHIDHSMQSDIQAAHVLRDWWRFFKGNVLIMTLILLLHFSERLKNARKIALADGMIPN